MVLNFSEKTFANPAVAYLLYFMHNNSDTYIL